MSKLTGKWRVGIVCLGVLVLAALVGYCHKFQSRVSSECLSIRNEIKSDLKIGDSEEKLKLFFVSKKWNYPYDSAMDGYAFQLPVKKTYFEKHFVTVYIGIVDHRIDVIEVRDAYTPQ